MHEALLGQIQLFPYEFSIQGWARCEGQIMNVQQNAALFSVLGNRFGGEAPATFALPDLRGKSPLEGLSYFISITGLYPNRQ
ncbi:phage tail protein [Oceanobacter mangrovi]|uniref:phage tail protein n=1 Tax=Oceanobacter mangrovi TaxID=2862510 RepID=UPI001C8DBE43|nr:tail fiber protein [Oceanobacter mangrovi]